MPLLLDRILPPSYRMLFYVNACKLWLHDGGEAHCVKAICFTYVLCLTVMSWSVLWCSIFCYFMFKMFHTTGIVFSIQIVFFVLFLLIAILTWLYGFMLKQNLEKIFKLVSKIMCQLAMFDISTINLKYITMIIVYYTRISISFIKCYWLLKPWFLCDKGNGWLNELGSWIT